jgi:hypothetical protein
MAISFVSHSDQRLIGDIEKLLKKKIELEAVEFEEDQPRERINTGRRHWGEDDPRDAIESSANFAPRGGRERSERPEWHERPDSARRRGGFVPAPVNRDPFFDKPYEETPVTTEARAAWETTAKASVRGSVNIKPKRRVAALFKQAVEGVLDGAAEGVPLAHPASELTPALA